MPANLIKSLAAKGKASEVELEKYWKEAKAAAKEGGKSESDPLFYGLVTKIFKAKVKKHLGVKVESMMHFKDFLIMEKFIMEKTDDGELFGLLRIKMGQKVKVGPRTGTISKNASGKRWSVEMKSYFVDFGGSKTDSENRKWVKAKDITVLKK